MAVLILTLEESVSSDARAALAEVVLPPRKGNSVFGVYVTAFTAFTRESVFFHSYNFEY